MTPSTRIRREPTPTSAAGIVTTPGPTMLPTTSPVAEVSPMAWALSLFRADIGGSGGTRCRGTSGALESGIGAAHGEQRPGAEAGPALHRSGGVWGAGSERRGDWAQGCEARQPGACSRHAEVGSRPRRACWHEAAGPLIDAHQITPRMTQLRHRGLERRSSGLSWEQPTFKAVKITALMNLSTAGRSRKDSSSPSVRT